MPISIKYNIQLLRKRRLSYKGTIPNFVMYIWHKDGSNPTNKITGLDSLLQNRAGKNIFETNISNPDSHTNYLAKKGASNLSNENIQSWKTMLGVEHFPSNIAAVNDYYE